MQMWVSVTLHINVKAETFTLYMATQNTNGAKTVVVAEV